MDQKQFVLQPYGDQNILWGPIYKGDGANTNAFYTAANLEGFQSPRHACPDGPWKLGSKNG